MNEKKYILGLDLGTSSLGWAVIEKDDREAKILSAGSSIFPQGIPADKLGKGKGREESNNADRRAKRQARRQLARRRLRKQHLLRVLIDKGMCPLAMDELDHWAKWNKKDEEHRVFPAAPRFRQWLALDPFLLRAEAVERPLTDDPKGQGFTAREKLGRILYSIIRHRGFLSSRKGKDAEEGKIFKSTLAKDGKTGINETREALRETTLGRYLYSIAPKSGAPFTDLSERVRSRYTLRDMYMDELEQIWDMQAAPLGLDNETVTTKHRRYFTGGGESTANIRRLERYRALDPKADIETLEEGAQRFVYSETLPLKEHLMGKVWRDDEGKLRYLSKESTLFWQRPLRSQRGLLDKCTYESYRVWNPKRNRVVTQGSRVVSTSHPCFELYRALQFVNNLRICDERPDLMLLDEILSRILSYKSAVKAEKLKKDLKIIGASLNFPDDFEVPACPTIAGIASLLDPKGTPERASSSSAAIKELHVPFDLKLYSRIWEKLFFFEDNHLLAKSLRKIEGVTFVDDLEAKLDKISLSDGYSNVSLHALRNILPYLLRGEQLASAVLLGGIRNAVKDDTLADSLDKELREWIREQRRPARGEMIDRIVALLTDSDGPFRLTLPEEKIRRLLYHPSQETERHRVEELLPRVENLRNPLVEQTLRAVRRQVNHLLRYYREHLSVDFRFDEIHVELARDLKASAEGRKKMRDRQMENKQVNDRAREALQGLGLRPSRENIQKYKLYEEIASRNNGIAVCPYTGKTIGGLTDALGPQSPFQIEHIVPRSVVNDDSLANKTLCDADFNRKKGNRTPYEYYLLNSDPKDWGADSWEEIAKRAHRLLPYRKAERFASKEKEEKGITSDQLVDTAYMSRKAGEYLTYICPPDDIRVFPGRVTAELRRLWGLNSILSDRVTLREEAVKDCSEETPVVVIADKESGEPRKVLPKFAPRPANVANTEDELILLVRQEKDLLCTTGEEVLPIVGMASRADAKKGEMYYLHLRGVRYVRLERMFAPVPRFGPQLLRARVTITIGKDGSSKLSSDQLDTRGLDRLTLPSVPGNYWLTIPLREVPAVEEEQPRARVPKGKLKVTGSIREGNFISRVYRREGVALDKGVAQVILDPIQEEAAFIKIKQEVPETSLDELVVTGAVDTRGIFTCRQDPDFRPEVETFGEVGQYYAVLSYDPTLTDTAPYLTPIPEIEKGEILVEGTMVRNDKDSRVYFSPAKNREDHRHHALDAVVIACAGQGMVSKMSEYNARRDDYSRGGAAGRGERPVFASPWETFREDAAQAIDSVLVKHKQNTRVLSEVTKTIYKEGRKHISKGKAVRGQLHKETFYGPRQSPHEPTPTMHYRVAIESITDRKLIDQVADPVIRRLMRERLEEMGVDTSQDDYSVPVGAFKDKKGRYTILLPNRRAGGEPVPVKKVRRSKVISNHVLLGKEESKKAVETKNNHHILIYEDIQGKVQEEVVTFWAEVDSELRGESELRLPPDAKRCIALLHINDMFVLGMTRDELAQAIASDDRALISKHLYRVQKLSSVYYVFRLHTASTLEHDEEMVRVQNLNYFQDDRAPIPVKVDPMGLISIAEQDD